MKLSKAQIEVLLTIKGRLDEGKPSPVYNRQAEATTQILEERGLINARWVDGIPHGHTTTWRYEVSLTPKGKQWLDDNPVAIAKLRDLKWSAPDWHDYRQSKDKKWLITKTKPIPTRNHYHVYYLVAEFTDGTTDPTGQGRDRWVDDDSGSATFGDVIITGRRYRRHLTFDEGGRATVGYLTLAKAKEAANKAAQLRKKNA